MKNRTVAISDLCQQIRGVSYKGGEAIDTPRDGYLPILRANNICDGEISYDDLVFVPQKYVSKTQVLQKNDVVIAASSGSLEIVGKAAQIKGEFKGSFGAFCKVLRPNSDVDSAYFSYFFKTPFYRHTISHLAAGANINNLRNEHLDNLKIPLPSFEIQRKNVAFLSKAESALEKRRQTLRLADEFLKSVFLEMFGEPGANLKDFKTSPIRDLVKKVINEDPPRYPAKSYSYVDISSIDNQLKKITETKQILGEDAPGRARQLLQAQDILVSTVRPNLNAVGVLPDGLSNPIGSTGFCVLRANRELVLPEYLFEICKTSFFIKSLVNVAKGASYPAVSDNDILRLSIPVPSLPEQQKFAELVQKVEKLKEKQKQSETQLQNLFNSLMQRAFRGDIL
ncbi:MAG: restriction endonuclease subunit S [Candidatus Omnitrophica bacterium]|nr:restriction endonuclease subunit S [Candidatus Omnitrophota bacterium]